MAKRRIDRVTIIYDNGSWETWENTYRSNEVFMRHVLLVTEVGVSQINVKYASE